VNGTDGDDLLLGTPASDALNGLSGSDTLNGGLGADILIGGQGNDIYVIDNSLDAVIEEFNEGVDIVKSSVSYTLSDNVENLTLTGTAAVSATGNILDNVLTGNNIANMLVGDEGNDRLTGGIGADTLLGGIGDDTYIIDSSLDVVTEHFNEGIDLVRSNVSYALADNIESLTLTETATISGTGNGLDNILTGNSADNSLLGGDGKDRLSGAAGADTLLGGLGDDTYIVDSPLDVVTEHFNEGIDLVRSSVSYTLADNIENLILTETATISGIGNALDNVLTGNGADNSLLGGDGNDKLIGAAGADTLLGGTGDDTYIINALNDVINENANEGNDTVETSITYTLGTNVENLALTGLSALKGTGNALDNLITGNNAANILTGAAGKDTLLGGLGADRFVYTSVTDTGVGTILRDIIQDFSSAQGDKIDVKAIDTNSNLAGVQQWAFVANGFSGVAGQVSFDGVSHLVQFDRNGDRAADMQIELTGVNTVTAADFVFV